IEAFNKKTGLTVEYWRASATKVMDRALAEVRAGKPAFDVMVNNSGAIYVMKKEGLFAKYISPSASAFPKDVIDPDLGPIYRNTPIGIIYNRGEIKPSDAPKDRKSTRLNSSHGSISYAVFCLKKKKQKKHMKNKLVKTHK